MLVLSAKLLGGAVHSLATWEDKLGIGEKITDASELISAFGQELKYEWENPEEYRERVEKAQALRKELDQAERALNAEAYHNQDDRELGYWSGAALQTVFGEEIIKQVAKGVSTTAKAAKVAGKVAEVSKVEGGVTKAAKAAKVEGGVAKGAARIEQIIHGASPQVQEAYASAKDWLGEGCRMVRNDKQGMVLVSKDGLRKFRTDLLDKKYPPHVHLEELRNGGWQDAVEGMHHIYPKVD